MSVTHLIREGEEFWDSKKEQVLVVRSTHEKFVRVEDSRGEILEIQVSPERFLSEERFTRLSDPENR